MPNHHLIDLEHLQMHTKRHTYHPKALRKIVFTRTGPISSSFNRSVLLKGAIREHTCPHLIDLVSNGVHHVLPSSSIRFGSRYALKAYLYDDRRPIFASRRIFAFSNSVDDVSSSLFRDKTTPTNDHQSNTE